MAKKKNRVPQDDIELNNKNSNSSDTTDPSAREQSAWHMLNMCNGIYTYASECGQGINRNMSEFSNTYLTKKNLQIAAGVTAAAGIIIGVVIIIVRYAVPDCKYFYLENQLGAGCKLKIVNGKTLNYLDSEKYSVPEEGKDYYVDLIAYYGSYSEIKCKAHITPNGITKRCEESGLETEHQTFTCTYSFQEVQDDDDDNSHNASNMASLVNSAVRSVYNFFRPSVQTATEQQSKEELVTEYNATSSMW